MIDDSCLVFMNQARFCENKDKTQNFRLDDAMKLNFLSAYSHFLHTLVDYS